MGRIKLLDPEKLTKTEVISLVSHEQTLRYSDRYQKFYEDNIIKGEKRNSMSTYMPVEDIIQKEVLSHFGYEPNELNLTNLRIMFGLFRDDPDVKKNAFWLNLNIIHDGVKVGTIAKSCKLYGINANEYNLLSLFSKDRPTIIMTGSIT